MRTTRSDPGIISGVPRSTWITPGGWNRFRSPSSAFAQEPVPGLMSWKVMLSSGGGTQEDVEPVDDVASGPGALTEHQQEQQQDGSRANSITSRTEPTLKIVGAMLFVRIIRNWVVAVMAQAARTPTSAPTAWRRIMGQKIAPRRALPRLPLGLRAGGRGRDAERGAVVDQKQTIRSRSLSPLVSRQRWT